MPATARRSDEPPRLSDALPAAVRPIAAFMAGASFEAARPSAAEIAALQPLLPPGTRVYLTALPHHMPYETLPSVARLGALGFEPVPHLAVRALPHAAMLEDVLARWAAAGVRRLLVIAGDYERPLGPYTQALDVIESGLLQRHGIVEVGIAGYPEGHPRIAGEALDRALIAKIEAAAQTGLGVHVVTQFGFDAGAALRWIGRLRDLGLETPLRIGLAGPTSLGALMQFARRCGVRASLHGVARHAGLTKRLIGMSAPDGLIRPLAEAYAEGRLGDVALHLYSFGGLAATARWAAAAAAGCITLDRNGGFSVAAP